MKLDFEVVDPNLGKDLHLAVDFLDEMGGYFDEKVTWGARGFCNSSG